MPGPFETPRWTPDVFSDEAAPQVDPFSPMPMSGRSMLPPPAPRPGLGQALAMPTTGFRMEDAPGGIGDAVKQAQIAADAAKASMPPPPTTALRDLPAAPPRPPLSLASLMAGLPMMTGGGSSSVSTTNAVLSPQQGAEFKRRLGEATASEQEATRAKSGISQAMYRDLAANSRESAAAQAAMYKATEAKRAEMDARIEAQMADNAAMLKEIKNTHIDPNRADKGWRQSLGVALGALGAGLSRGPNLVQQMVEARADRDLKAQTADLQNKHFVYQAGRNMLTDLYAKTGDLEKSYLLGKMAYTDIAKAQVDAITKNAQSEEVVQNGLAAIAQLDKAQVQNEMQLKQLEYKRITTTRTSGPGQLTPFAVMAGKAIIADRLGAGAGKPLSEKTSQGLGAVEAAISGVKKFQQEYLAEKDRGSISYGVNATLGGLWGSKVPAIEAQKEIIAAQLRKATETGVMTDKDFDRYAKAMPKITDHPTTARAKLSAVIQGLERDYGGQLSGLSRAGRDTSRYGVK